MCAAILAARLQCGTPAHADGGDGTALVAGGDCARRGAQRPKFLKKVHIPPLRANVIILK